ncbi:hypothetical protein [Streptomyces sp. FIT100]|uniref:hypothetical protein n=1 Tax=Streptomyces sp. FIT100 TaxID=2837956 RepID=UPI0021C58A8E|nr:hypothetical protein [Streptomyces sp. FIT100]UUN30927.1 hypothetical protein KK483_34795 [Streptomyces sp. FIT100]
MRFKADPLVPLAPGKKGNMQVLIQNVSNEPRKLDSYIGLAYRTVGAPGTPIFTTPPDHVDTLNSDTPVEGYFSPNSLPGDNVRLTITADDGKGQPKTVTVDATVEPVKQDPTRMRWHYTPKVGDGWAEDGWVVGTNYTVTAIAKLDNKESAASGRKFTGSSAEPSITVNVPWKDDMTLSPKSRLTGGYGGIVKNIEIVVQGGSSLTVRKDDPVYGTWTADPPEGGWVANRRYTITARAKNPEKSSDPVQRTFEVRELPPGAITISHPDPSVLQTGHYTPYNLPQLQGDVNSPCDRVFIIDPQQSTGEIDAVLEPASNSDSYTWRLDPGWKYSDTGIEHSITAFAQAGNQKSEHPATVTFIMETARDNPLRFTHPQEGVSLEPEKVSLDGGAFSGTKSVTITDIVDGKPSQPIIVNTTTTGSITTWTYPSKEWEIGKHKIFATANNPYQENSISFTVTGPRGLEIQTPQNGATIHGQYFTLEGSIPGNSNATSVQIEDTCNGQPREFSVAKNSWDQRFKHAETNGWPVGNHVLKATIPGYEPCEITFTVQAT